MYTYLISYDLTKPETSTDYAVLIAKIKAYGYWAKPLKSLWLIKTNNTAAQVRDELLPVIDLNDKLLVIDITHGSWGSYNLSNDVVDWIKSNL